MMNHISDSSKTILMRDPKYETYMATKDIIQTWKLIKSTHSGKGSSLGRGFIPGEIDRELLENLESIVMGDNEYLSTYVIMRAQICYTTFKADKGEGSGMVIDLSLHGAWARKTTIVRNKLMKEKTTTILGSVLSQIWFSEPSNIVTLVYLLNASSSLYGPRSLRNLSFEAVPVTSIRRPESLA
jgi:hypothetical protein